MVAIPDAQQAVQVLKQLGDTEIEWLTRLSENPASMDPAEIMSHAGLLKNLIWSQNAFALVLVNHIDKTNYFLETIVAKLGEEPEKKPATPRKRTTRNGQ